MDSKIIKEIFSQIREVARDVKTLKSVISGRSEVAGALPRRDIADLGSPGTEGRLAFVRDSALPDGTAGNVAIDFGGAWIYAFSNGYIPEYTVAALAGVTTGGRLAYATNGRKPTEGVGAGTGVLVYRDNSNIWISVHSGVAITA